MLSKNKIEWIRVWKRIRVTDSSSASDVKQTWSYSIVGVLDRFESAIFHSQFSDMGDFELVLPYDESILGMFSLTDTTIGDWGLDKAQSIYLEPVGIEDLFCLDHVKITTDENGVKRIVCTGVGGLGLMRNQVLADYQTTDGKATAFVNPTIDGMDINAIATDGTNVIAVGQYGLACISSDDGETWTHISNLEALCANETYFSSRPTLSAVSKCGNYWYVGGSSRAFFYSSDAVTWNVIRPSGMASDTWIHSIGSVYIEEEPQNGIWAVGSASGAGVALGGNDLYPSDFEVIRLVDDQGASLKTALSAYATRNDDVSMLKLGIFVGTNDGNLYRQTASEQGKATFTKITSFSSSVTDIKGYGGHILVSAYNYMTEIDANGNVVQNVTLPSGSAIASLGYANGRWVGVGYNGMWTSTDIATWTEVDYGRYSTDDWNGVVYGRNRFVVVGNDGKGMYSDNGTQWSVLGNTGFNTPFLQNGEAINFIFYLMIVGNGHGRYVDLRDYYDSSYNSNRRGYIARIDKSEWTEGGTILDSSEYVMDVNLSLVDEVLSYARKYKCGFVVSMNSTPFPEITVRDKKNNTGVYLTENMNSVSEQELDFDLEGIGDCTVAVGQNDVNSAGNQLTGVNLIGTFEDSVPLYSSARSRNYPRIKAYSSEYKRNLTDNKLDKNELYLQLSGDAKNHREYSFNPIQYVSGKINLKSQSQSNWPFRKKVGVGDVCNIVAYGRTVQVMITGLTYVQDSSGFTIDAEYEGV